MFIFIIVFFDFIVSFSLTILLFLTNSICFVEGVWWNADLCRVRVSRGDERHVDWPSWCWPEERKGLFTVRFHFHFSFANSTNKRIKQSEALALRYLSEDSSRKIIAVEEAKEFSAVTTLVNALWCCVCVCFNFFFFTFFLFLLCFSLFPIGFSF